MKLPQHLHHFPHASLLVVSDHIMAKFFLAGGEDVEELEGVALPREPRQEPEGPFGKISEMDDEPRLNHFIKQLTRKIEDYVRDHDITSFHLVMPADVEHLLSAELPADLHSKQGRVLHADLMKEPIIEVIERLYTR